MILSLFHPWESEVNLVADFASSADLAACLTSFFTDLLFSFNLPDLLFQPAHLTKDEVELAGEVGVGNGLLSEQGGEGSEEKSKRKD